MKPLWQILALVMLALMVPASTCCQWVGDCNAGACCTPDHDDHDGGDHQSPTNCPSDTISHSQLPAPVVLPPVELVALIQAMIRLQDEFATTTESSILPMTTAPPEMRVSWHLTQRTALPVRAPSILA